MKRNYFLLLCLFTVIIIFIGCSKKGFYLHSTKSTYAIIPEGYEIVEDFVADAEDGTLYYTDRNKFRFISIPPYLINTTLIKTPNNLKADTTGLVIYFEVPMKVYIGYDINRAMNRPFWLSETEGWRAPGGSIVVNDEPANPLAIYKKDFAHGAVYLGGNWCYPAIPGGSNYIIFYEPLNFITPRIGDTLLIMCESPPDEYNVIGYKLYLLNFAGTNYSDPVCDSQNILETTYDGLAMEAIKYVVDVEPVQYYLYLTAYNMKYESEFSKDIIPIQILDEDVPVPSEPRTIIVIFENFQL